MEAFRRAQQLNEKIGKPMYGGSTITMQVARTLFLVPTKSYLRKYLEVIAALELEAILSKDRILELYFSYAEWGKGIFGIERASRVYYGKGIASITADQAARLIALLSSPIKYTPSTLYRSTILRQRYSYLVARYVAPVPAAVVAAEAPPPAGIEPSVDIEEQEQPQEMTPNDGTPQTILPQELVLPNTPPHGGCASEFRRSRCRIPENRAENFAPENAAQREALPSESQNGRGAMR